MKLLTFKLFELFKKSNDEDSLLEMARINNPKTFKYDVFVYGGDSYGSGRKEHGAPHFHFADNIKSGSYNFSVLIPTPTEWETEKKLEISEGGSWDGKSTEYKELIEWLDKPYHLIPAVTNLGFIRVQWNVLNTNNKNVSQIEL